MAVELACLFSGSLAPSTLLFLRPYLRDVCVWFVCFVLSMVTEWQQMFGKEGF